MQRKPFTPPYKARRKSAECLARFRKDVQRAVAQRAERVAAGGFFVDRTFAELCSIRDGELELDADFRARRAGLKVGS